MDPEFARLHGLRDAYDAAAAQSEQARAAYVAEIRRLRDRGRSLREIGDEIGLSPQRVHQLLRAQRVRDVEDRMRNGFFDRFDETVRSAIATGATEAAPAAVSPAHLLLGLASVCKGGVGRVLTDSHITADRVRDALGSLPSAPDGVGFDDETKDILEDALRRARRLRERIAAHHVLLALLRRADAAEGMARSVCASLRVEPVRVQNKILERLLDDQTPTSATVRRSIPVPTRLVSRPWP